MHIAAALGLRVLLPPRAMVWPLLIRGRGEGWWQEGLDTNEPQTVPGLVLTLGAMNPTPSWWAGALQDEQLYWSPISTRSAKEAPFPAPQLLHWWGQLFWCFPAP